MTATVKTLQYINIIRYDYKLGRFNLGGPGSGAGDAGEAPAFGERRKVSASSWLAGACSEQAPAGASVSWTVSVTGGALL